jgi:hypothetical protein
MFVLNALERGEQVFKRLQVALEGAKQEYDQNRKGENALSGNAFIMATMIRNKVGIMKECREMGENAGMDTFKSATFIIIIYQCITVYNIA